MSLNLPDTDLRHQWHRCNDEPSNVFLCFDGDRRVGRILKSSCGDYWHWYMHFNAGLRDLTTLDKLGGRESSAIAAAERTEACYVAVVSGTWPGMTKGDADRLLRREQTRNSAATAATLRRRL